MMSTRLKNILRFANIKDLRDFEAIEKWQVKQLPEMGKVTFKELYKLMEAENIRFLDLVRNPSVRRCAIYQPEGFYFYVRLSTMDEDPSFIRENKTMVLD